MADPQLTETDRPAGRGTIFAWGVWDWGASGFNTVVVTFIFSVYLTNVVGDDLPGTIEAGTWYTWSVAAAGVLIAVLAPVSGQQADLGGRRRRSLAIFSILVLLCMIGLFWVRDDSSYFWLGAALIGLGSVFFEIAAVFYNAMLRQISTPATIGRVSGFGWSMGYFGGIFLLLICYFGFIAGDGDTRGFLGISTEDGFNIRVVALVAAVWFGLSALPVLFAVPEVAAAPKRERTPLLSAYRKLFRDIAELFRTDRQIAFFLIASAIFRDGLAAIFHFGAILAVLVYGISDADVLIFGVAANVISAIGALSAGVLDDRVGPRFVIVVSLVGLIITGTVLLFLSGPMMFWIFGLVLCLFVGPAQSASRTFLMRITPPGREGQIFGLYATTGRAVSFLAPGLYGLFAAVLGGQRYGTVGIVIVLLAGLIAMRFVGRPVDKSAAPVTSGTPVS
ncbi:MFS transporter [Nakamurella sp. YIM 132087]|uniref:MFS transporter n=1 Tax=Nakamurella alba TaxID=2665158 RepID=A0A7K1FQ80_9ACTN|nr:MFS transporter [Nakamurella alba]MTD15403.1 MFS transporter [Nakamurella alba]